MEDAPRVGGVSMAGPQGFEPRPTGPKPGVLPLDDGPSPEPRATCCQCVEVGWPTGTRTPTNGTRIRCPAIRRWANATTARQRVYELPDGVVKGRTDDRAGPG